MRNFNAALLTVILTFVSFFAIAQDGEYDVRFDLHKVDCATNQIFILIEVRANNSAHEFYISDQNYRFSYNRNAVVQSSLAIDSMYLTGFIGSSLYEPHTLTGTLDTVVSYNAALAGGTGELIDTTWRTIGRISFDILDINQCLNLIWHDHSPAWFPPTFVGEKVGQFLFEVDERLYFNTSVCPDPICRALPIELVSFEAKEEACSVVLNWQTASEENNDYFLLEKSTDGDVFNAIHTIKGAGNSNQLKHYTYTDTKASPLNYYRLTQVDFNGVATVHETITVRSSCFEEGNAFMLAEIYPNPVTNGPIKIRFYTEVEMSEVSIIISDVMGRTLHTIFNETTLGQNTFTIDSKILAAGTYFIRIENDDYVSKARRIVKINY